MLVLSNFNVLNNCMFFFFRKRPNIAKKNLALDQLILVPTSYYQVHMKWKTSGHMVNNNIENLIYNSSLLRCDIRFEVKLSLLSKINEIIDLLQKFQGIFPRTFLLKVYKSFATPHLGYGENNT